MAHCVAIQTEGGMAFVRLSGKRKKPAPCDFCGRPHSRLCDAMTEDGRGTCSAKLCDRCTIKSGQQDFCPVHKALA
jgi:hypothetical protein